MAGISESSSAPARHRARDSSAVRIVPSVVDGECDFQGPGCDGKGVGSGHMVYSRASQTFLFRDPILKQVFK